MAIQNLAVAGLPTLSISFLALILIDNFSSFIALMTITDNLRFNILTAFGPLLKVLLIHTSIRVH